MTTGKVSLFDCLKMITVVVKTRKPYGFQAFWLSHTQHDHIGTKNCKSGHEFEIKTDKSLGHATLPPSTHRNDKTFRYSHIGRTDKIETIDELYSLLIAGTQKKKDEIKNSNSANVTTIVVTTTSPTTPVDIDYSSSTTPTKDKEQENLTSDASVASDNSSVIITDNKSIEKIELKHSPAAHVLTNDDLEDIDNISNESRGESV
jgi:hypothetical protein